MNRLVVLLLIPLVVHAENKPEKAEIGKEFVSQFRIGSHTYVEDGKRSTRNTALWGVVIGKHVAPNLMLGVGTSFARRRYEAIRRNVKVSYEVKVATSVIAIGRWVFRPNRPLQPYVDAGIGRTEVLDDGQRISLTVGIGAQYRFSTWAITIESRGIGWSSYALGSPDGANEITLGYAIFF